MLLFITNKFSQGKVSGFIRQFNTKLYFFVIFMGQKCS